MATCKCCGCTLVGLEELIRGIHFSRRFLTATNDSEETGGRGGGGEHRLHGHRVSRHKDEHVPTAWGLA